MFCTAQWASRKRLNYDFVKGIWTCQKDERGIHTSSREEEEADSLMYACDKVVEVRPHIGGLMGNILGVSRCVSRRDEENRRM